MKVRSHLTLVLTFASAFASNIVSMVMRTLMQRMGTEPILLHFVTIASIIFENTNAEIDCKCEWSFMRFCYM